MKAKTRARVARRRSLPLRSSWTKVGSFRAFCPKAVGVMPDDWRKASTSESMGSGARVASIGSYIIGKTLRSNRKKRIGFSLFCQGMVMNER
jgi:hypothetical protein